MGFEPAPVMVPASAVSELFNKAKIYIKDPSRAPEGAKVQTGPSGGYYYESEGKPGTPEAEGLPGSPKNEYMSGLGKEQIMSDEEWEDEGQVRQQMEFVLENNEWDIPEEGSQDRKILNTMVFRVAELTGENPRDIAEEIIAIADKYGPDEPRQRGGWPAEELESEEPVQERPEGYETWSEGTGLSSSEVADIEERAEEMGMEPDVVYGRDQLALEDEARGSDSPSPSERNIMSQSDNLIIDSGQLSEDLSKIDDEEAEFLDLTYTDGKFLSYVEGRLMTGDITRAELYEFADEYAEKSGTIASHHKELIDMVVDFVPSDKNAVYPAGSRPPFAGIDPGKKALENPPIDPKKKAGYGTKKAAFEKVINLWKTVYPRDSDNKIEAMMGWAGGRGVTFIENEAGQLDLKPLNKSCNSCKDTMSDYMKSIDFIKVIRRLDLLDAQDEIAAVVKTDKDSAALLLLTAMEVKYAYG